LGQPEKVSLAAIWFRSALCEQTYKKNQSVRHR